MATIVPGDPAVQCAATRPYARLPSGVARLGDGTRTHCDIVVKLNGSRDTDGFQAPAALAAAHLAPTGTLPSRC